MKNKWKNRVFIDLFSGPGRCRVRPQGLFTDGSPLIALGEVFTHYFFIDISPYCIDILNKRTHANELTNGKEIKTMTGDVNHRIDDLSLQLNAIGPDTLGFAFVDPPGIQLEFETLKKLSSNTRIDLLINFPLGMNIKRQIWHQRQKAPDTESTFDKYFGTKQWRDLSDNDFIGYRLLELYKEQLRSLGYDYVGDEHSVKNRGVNLYMLVFASKNPKGREFWEKVTQVAPSGQRRLF